jgi:ZIP family zinc transporter
MSTLAAVGAAAVAVASTTFGGVAALRWSRRIPLLMAGAGGVVLAAAFFDLLPEAVSRAQETGLDQRWPLGLVAVGYLTFHILEQVVHRDRHHHLPDHGGHADEDDHHQDPDPAGLVGAAGFVIHSLMDGLAIGLGFQVDSRLGLLVAAAVVAHDFSDGLNTVSYLVAHHQPPSRTRRWLAADAIAPFLGALVASSVSLPAEVFPIGLGFFCGLFVFTATTTLLPRAAELPLRRSLPLTLLGATAMFLVSLGA